MSIFWLAAAIVIGPVAFCCATAGESSPAECDWESASAWSASETVGGGDLQRRRAAVRRTPAYPLLPAASTPRVMFVRRCNSVAVGHKLSHELNAPLVI